MDGKSIQWIFFFFFFRWGKKILFGKATCSQFCLIQTCCLPFSHSIHQGKCKSSYLFICALVWLCWVLLLHISISAYCCSGLCSLACFSQTNCGFKSKRRDLQALGNYRGFVRVIYSTRKYCVVILALKHQKESREKNCSVFHFFPLRIDSEKRFTFLNCLHRSSMSFLIRTPR